jgi:uncharacterized protein YbjT (DUF2867 family)
VEARDTTAVSLVVGATGLLGRAVCRRLREAGHPVRALARRTSAGTDALAQAGVEVAWGDLRDTASLGAACQGVQTLVSTATATSRKESMKTVDRDGQLALVAAARAAGVRRIVYVSLSPNLPENTPLVRYKHEVERAVRASGMTWTVLQPSCFMEVWFSPVVGWDIAAGKVRITGSGERPVSFISLEDVAHMAALAIDRPETQGRDIPLGGPKPVSLLAAAKTFEDALGRKLKRQHVPPAVLGVVARVLMPLQPTLASLMLLGVAVSKGDAIDMAPLQREFPLRLTSVAEYARRTAGAEAPR